MNTRVISLSKYFLGLFVALVALVIFAAPASAESRHNYQYQSVGWQFQQPVFYQYQYRSDDLRDLQKQLQSLLTQLNTLQTRYYQIYGRSYGRGFNFNNNYDLEVDTLYARDVEDEAATLYGEVELDDAPYANVWFEYGEDSDLDERTDKERVDDDERFDIDVDDLDEDEEYYFRAIAEAPNGERAYGQIKSFTAGDEDENDDDEDEDDDEGVEPDVETGSADDIDEESAELEGEVDMNDFEDGEVFFVWGEDEDAIEDVENEDNYDDIDEDGDNLQKYRVHDSLDGNRTFWLTIFGLDEETEYYYRACVEYEDEDDDVTLVCGDVEYFETE